MTIGAAPVDISALNLALNVTQVPAGMTAFTILNNVTGTFANAADMSTLAVDGNQYTVSYVGNDVQLALVGALAVETDVRVDGSGNLIIEDINGGTSNDNLSLAVVGANYVVTASDPVNVLGSTAGGTVASASQVTIPLTSVTGGIQFLSGGGTDTLAINSNLTLNGSLDIQSADVTALDGWTVDTSAANGAINIGGTLNIQGPNGDLQFSAGSGDITIAGNGANTSDFRVLRHSGPGTLTIDSNVDSTGGIFFDGLVASGNNPPIIVNGDISGAGVIEIRNDAFVTVAGDNSAQTGNWNINAAVGESRLTVTSLNGLGAGLVTINNTNARLAFDVDGTFANNITMNNTGNQKLLEVVAGHSVELTGTVALNETSSTGSRNQLFIRAGSTLTISGTLDADASGFQVQGGDATSRLIVTNGNANNLVAGRINIDTGDILIRESAAIGTALVQLNNSNTAFVLGNGVNAANNVTMTNRNNNKFIRLEDGATTASLSGTLTFSGNGAAENQIDLAAGQTLTITGTATGAPIALRVVGDGTTVFDAGATTDFSGILDIDGGTVLLNSTLSAATVDLAAGARLGGQRYRYQHDYVSGRDSPRWRWNDSRQPDGLSRSYARCRVRCRGADYGNHDFGCHHLQCLH